jgi:Polyketide cyclase / dehydrase and lipid transport
MERMLRSLEASIDIRAEPEAVFDRIHDYGRRLEWDTFLQEARLLDGAGRAGLGVKTRCTARSGFAGLAMDTVYISFDRPRVAAVKMTHGPAILQSFAASIRQEEIEPGVTRVTYRFQFRTRPRWLRAILDRLAALLFLVETRQRLAALKRHLEKGT